MTDAVTTLKVCFTQIVIVRKRLHTNELNKFYFGGMNSTYNAANELCI